MHIINIEMNYTWERFYKPNAELGGQIANPQVYKAYFDAIKKEERKKEEKKKGKSDSGFYENDVRGLDSEHYYTEAEANSKYDPLKGLVDNDGNVIIPKEQYDKLLGLGEDGVAVSY